MLAASDDDDDSDAVEASAFKAGEAGKCSNVSGEKGEGESAWQVGDETWLCDSGASTHMTPSADGMINYRECNLKLRITDGSTRTIEGSGDINFAFRSGNGLVRVTLTNVAHVPDFRHNLFSLPTVVKHGHTFEGRPAGIVVKLKSERSIVFPLTGNMYSLYGYRVDCTTRGDACAVLAPGKLPNKPVVNMNDYHCAQSSKGSSSRESYWSAKDAPWRRVSVEVSSSPHPLEQIRSSGGFLWVRVGLKW